jgi:excisionase family DNA binding protein
VSGQLALDTREIREQLEAALAPGLVDALEQLVAETVRNQLAAAGAAAPSRRWLTVVEAAEKLACSERAIYMRVHRGRLEHRHQGRRLYVSAVSVDELGRL